MKRIRKIVADYPHNCKEGVSLEVAISMSFHGTPTLAGVPNADMKSMGIRDEKETERNIQH